MFWARQWRWGSYMLFSWGGKTALTIIIFAALLAGGYFYVAYFNPLPEVIVPDVSGALLETARQKLEESGLRARAGGEVYDLKNPPGLVVSQRPEAGRSVKAGRVISLMITSTGRRASVPNLLGRQLSQAGEIIAAAEFALGEVRLEKNLSVENGTIMAQEPLPGEAAPAGSRIDLLVSTTGEVVKK